MSGIFGSGVKAVYQIQSAFSTFPSSGTWIPLSAYEHSDGETEPREVDPLLGRAGFNRRDPEASAPGLPQGGGAKVVPICLREHGWWLTACFGEPETTEDDGVFTHVWESGADVIPTLAQSKFLATGSYLRSRGVCVDTYALNLAKEAGYPRASLGLMLRDEAANASEVTGTIAEPYNLLRAPAATPFVRIDNTPRGVTAVTFNYANQTQRFDPLNGGPYPEALDAEDALVNGSMTWRAGDATMDGLASASTPFKAEFGYLIAGGLGPGLDASITWEVSRAIFDKGPLAISGRGRVIQTRNFQGEQTNDAPA
ncbi:MAG TPA: phage tail tube protein, partial [Terricaulis sp.]|nr:phage tail tube protein [Terricaulis sp.]